MQPVRLASLIVLALTATAAPAADRPKIPYEKFESPDACAACHVDFTRQHEQALMSQSYTHHWDEIEYFQLALPHARKEPKVAEVEAGCNGCHAPLAFLAGDIPPKPPKEGTRANEGVSCDLCHAITGFDGDVPFNFNYRVEPGDAKSATRAPGEGAVHATRQVAFLKSAEYCGTCHNEKDPWGLWVKATHLEWKEGPHGKAGIVCQDCHMPKAEGVAADGGEPRKDVRQHLFHGAHDAGKLAGVVEVRIHPQDLSVKAGAPTKLTAVLVNAKAGHMVPSGSAEERVLWLEVEARDARGRILRLPVDRKGFEGEDYTIASSKAKAYQDIGDIKGLTDFAGLARDGEVPDGCRIFRLPYLDPKGRMTIAQWNTAAFGPDYRLKPLVAVNETYTWNVPADVSPGKVEVVARVYYSRLVSSVAEYLGVPREESVPVLVSEHRTSFDVVAP